VVSTTQKARLKYYLSMISTPRAGIQLYSLPEYFQALEASLAFEKLASEDEPKDKEWKRIDWRFGRHLRREIELDLRSEL
jgi:hypothetical protein